MAIRGTLFVYRGSLKRNRRTWNNSAGRVLDLDDDGAFGWIRRLCKDGHGNSQCEHQQTCKPAETKLRHMCLSFSVNCDWFSFFSNSECPVPVFPEFRCCKCSSNDRTAWFWLSLNEDSRAVTASLSLP